MTGVSEQVDLATTRACASRTMLGDSRVMMIDDFMITNGSLLTEVDVYRMREKNERKYWLTRET